MKKNYLLLLGILLSTTAVWTQPFWSEDFSNITFPIGWTTEDSTDVGLIWEHCDNLYKYPPFTQNQVLENANIDLQRFEARTAFNGYLFANPQGMGTGTDEFNTRLTMPTLDFSDKNRVVLVFSTNLIYKFRTPAEASFLQVKNESGEATFQLFPTWDEGVPGFPTNSTWNGHTLYIDISEAAAGFSEVEIEWLWQGFNDFNWAIDDVELYDYHPLYENAIWGMVEGEGDFSGGLNDWELGNNNPVCPWEWNEKGWIDNQNNAQTDYFSICSNTPENGAAIMNATICAAMNPQVETLAQLISPSVDLSEVEADCEISLRFFQQVEIGNTQNVNTPITTIDWSVDGSTWSDPIDANPLAESFEITCDELTIPLPNELIGESNVRFRFTFSGTSFYWAIDDVRVMRNAVNDCILKENFYAIAPNFQTPKSQVDSFALLVDIQNFGKNLQEDVTVAARIYDGENQDLIYQDFLQYDTVESLQLIENDLFPSKAIVPAVTGRYYGEYEISGAAADENLSNNRINWEFEISDSIFAKERGFRTGFAPSGAAVYEIGNCFYVPKGDGFHAEKVTFGYFTYPPFEDAVLQVNIYKWNISSPLDSIAEAAELDFLGGTSFINQEAFGSQVETVSLSPLTGDKIFLENDTYYLVTVAYTNPLNCGGGDCPFFIAASDEFNYDANYFLSRNLTGNPRFASVLRQGNSTDFNTIGFNLKRTPVVRLHIANNTVGTHDRNLSEDYLTIFPNPAKEEIFVTFETPFIIKPVTITIYNEKGVEVIKQMILTQNIEQMPVKVGLLSSGWYALEVQLEDGRSVSKSFFKL